MDTASRETLQMIAGQLAAIVGVLHLGMGTYYVVGASGAAVSGDPRVLLWGIAGTVLVAGVAAGALGWLPRGLYAGGIGVVFGLLAGHFLWPILVGGSFYLGPAPVTPASDVLGYLHEQVTAVRPVAQAAVAIELALVVLLVALSTADEQL